MTVVSLDIAWWISGVGGVMRSVRAGWQKHREFKDGGIIDCVDVRMAVLGYVVVVRSTNIEALAEPPVHLCCRKGVSLLLR